MDREKTKHRDELLERATRYVLQHGLATLSLRPLAEHVGTTARMLIYHFGSKEALVTALLERAIQRQQAALRDVATATPVQPPADILRAFWQELTREDLRPLVCLVLEVNVLGVHEPRYAALAQAALTGWHAVVGDILSARPLPGPHTLTPTLIVGAVSGLLLDLVISQDAQRVHEAFEALIASLSVEETHE